MSFSAAELVACERAEVAAWTSVWAAAPADLAETLGMAVREVGGAVALAARRVPSWMANRILGLGSASAATAAQLEELVGLFEGGDSPHAVSLAAPAQPVGVPWLQARGFAVGNTWAKMVRRTNGLPPVRGELPVRAIGAEHAEDFAAVCAAGFEVSLDLARMFAGVIGRDGWRIYLARDGGTAAACAGLFVQDRVGWLGFGTSRPEHRGRGLHRALVARRVRDALELGCRLLVSETRFESPPNQSNRNLQRNGFVAAYERPNYVRTPGAGAGAPGPA